MRYVVLSVSLNSVRPAGIVVPTSANPTTQLHLCPLYLNPQSSCIHISRWPVGASAQCLHIQASSYSTILMVRIENHRLCRRIESQHGQNAQCWGFCPSHAPGAGERQVTAGRWLTFLGPLPACTWRAFLFFWTSPYAYEKGSNTSQGRACYRRSNIFQKMSRRTERGLRECTTERCCTPDLSHDQHRRSPLVCQVRSPTPQNPRIRARGE